MKLKRCSDGSGKLVRCPDSGKILRCAETTPCGGCTGTPPRLLRVQIFGMVFHNECLATTRWDNGFLQTEYLCEFSAENSSGSQCYWWTPCQLVASADEHFFRSSPCVDEYRIEHREAWSRCYVRRGGSMAPSRISVGLMSQAFYCPPHQYNQLVVFYGEELNAPLDCLTIPHNGLIRGQGPSGTYPWDMGVGAYALVTIAG